MIYFSKRGKIRAKINSRIITKTLNFIETNRGIEVGKNINSGDL